MAKKLSENELRRQAVQALSESLGPVDALRFLALVSREPFDYQEWRREYFSQFNVDELLKKSASTTTAKCPEHRARRTSYDLRLVSFSREIQQENCNCKSGRSI